MSYRKQRDRFLFYIFILVTTLYLYQLFPESTVAAVSQMVAKKSNLEIVLNTTGQYLTYFGILTVSVILSFRYWQVSRLIERQYAYLQKVEQDLSSLYSSSVSFRRENDFSWEENPILSIWSSKLYDLFFSLAFFFFGVLAVTSALRHDGFSWSDLIVCILGIMFLLYFNVYWFRRRRR